MALGSLSFFFLSFFLSFFSWDQCFFLFFLYFYKEYNFFFCFKFPFDLVFSLSLFLSFCNCFSKLSSFFPNSSLVLFCLQECIVLLFHICSVSDTEHILKESLVSKISKKSLSQSTLLRSTKEYKVVRILCTTTSVLYISNSVWVLHTPNTGKSPFPCFLQYFVAKMKINGSKIR